MRFNLILWLSFVFVTRGGLFNDIRARFGMGIRGTNITERHVRSRIRSQDENHGNPQNDSCSGRDKKKIGNEEDEEHDLLYNEGQRRKSVRSALFEESFDPAVQSSTSSRFGPFPHDYKNAPTEVVSSSTSSDFLSKVAPIIGSTLTGMIWYLNIRLIVDSLSELMGSFLAPEKGKFRLPEAFNPYIAPNTTLNK